MQTKTATTPYKEVQKDKQKMLKQSKITSFFTLVTDSPSSMRSALLYHPDISHPGMSKSSDKYY
jgi:hypothetical protein